MNYNELKKTFENRRFKTCFFETKEEAAQYLVQNIQGESVALGGSVTLAQMGIYKLLGEKNSIVAHGVIPGENTIAFARGANVYISSVNALSKSGEIVNIDGTGNRISMMAYGPKRLYLVVGKNKIVDTLQGAIDRAKNIAAPLNAQRLKRNTPCAINGDKCYNCDSADRICNATLILERPTSLISVEIIFVNENMGY